MSQIFHFLGGYNRLFLSIINHIKSIENYFAKSDDESVEQLLKNPKDKIKFEKTIDYMISNNIKSTNIKLKNKDVKISI